MSSNVPEVSTYTNVQTFRAYQAAFMTPAGEIVLEDLKRAGHMYGSLIDPGDRQIDPMRMAIAEGERNMVLRILAILQSKENDYVPRCDARE